MDSFAELVTLYLQPYNLTILQPRYDCIVYTVHVCWWGGSMVAVPPPRLNSGFSYCTVRNPDVWHSHCVVCITLILSKQRNRCFPTNMLEIKGQCADCVFIFVGDDLLYCASLQLPSQYLNSPPSKAQGSELSAIETFSARCRHKLYNLLYSSSFHR